MKWRPVFHFREKTIFKAFLLSAIALGIQMAFTMYFQRSLDEYENTHLQNLTEFQKGIIVILATVLFCFLSFVILRLLFGFGKGLVIQGQIRNSFW